MNGGIRKWIGRGALALALAGVATGAAWKVAAARRPPCPGAHWTTKAPEAAGFSSAKLQAFADRAGGAGCLVQGGEMIFTWGDVAFRGDVASSCKPIYAFLTFKAIELGLIGSLDEPILRWAPEIGNLNADLGYKDRAITFRHLLSQTSGYGLAEKPGEAFAYNDFATGLLVWTLFYRVYGKLPVQYDELLNGEWLGQWLKFEDQPTANYQNASYPNQHRGRIRMSARDMARFALLYLRGGEWNGRRLLRQDLFEQAMDGTLPLAFPRTSGREAEDLSAQGWKPIGGGKNEKNHLGCLGYFWWHNETTPDGARFLPDAPPRTFMGSGYGGRFAMVVVPELDLVAVWLNVHEEDGQKAWSPLSEIGRFKVNDMLRELLAARAKEGMP